MKFLELIESNGEIGAWGLVDRLVAHHVELLQITPMVRWAMSIHVAPMGHLCVSVMLAIGVLRQASVVLIGGFAIPGGAIMADVENHATKPWKESREA